MSRKVMIALVAIVFAGAMAASRTADAQRGSFGGGMRAGAFAGGGFRASGGFRGFAGPGFRGGVAPAFRGGLAGPRFEPRFAGAGFRGPRFAGPGFRRFAAAPGFHRHPGFFRPPFRRFAHRRFFRRSFAFAAVPFFVGAAPHYYYYDDPCWAVEYTPWGPRYVYVCNYYYD